jgi:biopolymer transport protein ExbD
MQEEDGDVEVQMAPLIDCMFLLLIFFLVATTLKDFTKELDIQLPEADAAMRVPVDPNTLVLGFDREGNYYVNGEPATKELLLEKIEKAVESKMVVRIDGDRRADYESCVELMELCRIQGVQDVKLRTRKEE